MELAIHKETVTDLLWSLLNRLMRIEEFSSFRLVGGTSLSLILGHRMSIDIDLFTDSEYGTIDFKEIYKVINQEIKYVSPEEWVNETMGNSCLVGESNLDTVKLDLFYTDEFIFPIMEYNKIRLSSLEEIAAMKLDVIGRSGRKKDFWDIHALLDHFTLKEMLEFYKKRYPFNFSSDEIIIGLNNFEKADQDPKPNCLLGKYWELIKLDIEELEK